MCFDLYRSGLVVPRTIVCVNMSGTIECEYRLHHVFGDADISFQTAYQVAHNSSIRISIASFFQSHKYCFFIVKVVSKEKQHQYEGVLHVTNENRTIQGANVFHFTALDPRLD